MSELASALQDIRDRAGVVVKLGPPLPAGRGESWNAAAASATDVPRLLAAVDAALAIHKPFRIYDECDHEHTEDEFEADQVVLIDTGYACEEAYMYSICSACCRDAQGFQNEECAGSHFHDATHCKTAVAISRALLGKGNPDA